MNKRLLSAIAASAILAGCAYAPPSPDDNPYYTTKPLKPAKPRTSPKSYGESEPDVYTSPVPSPSAVTAKPLPLPKIQPGKTLPAPLVYQQPAYGLEVNELAQFDVNRDGVVTVDEMLSVNVGWVMEYDRNGDGYLSEAEFLQSTGDRRNRFSASTNIFQHIDTNRDGRLSSKEVAAYLSPSIAALDPRRTGIITRLNPIPEFPSAASVPPASTIGSGLPRLSAPGAEGPSQRTLSAKGRGVKVAPAASKAAAAPKSRGKTSAAKAKPSSKSKAAPAKQQKRSKTKKR